jgi:hypothetical protein
VDLSIPQPDIEVYNREATVPNPAFDPDEHLVEVPYVDGPLLAR